MQVAEIILTCAILAACGFGIGVILLIRSERRLYEEDRRNVRKGEFGKFIEITDKDGEVHVVPTNRILELIEGKEGRAFIALSEREGHLEGCECSESCAEVLEKIQKAEGEKACLSK